MDLIGKSRGFNFWCRIIAVIFFASFGFLRRNADVRCVSPYLQCNVLEVLNTEAESVNGQKDYLSLGKER